MPASHTKSVALTIELEKWVDEVVETGEYKSASEVIRDGLRLLRANREREVAELSVIKARIQASLAQADAGTFADGSGEDAIRRSFAMARTKQRV
ncbi:MAG: type II toxin-antitoxin system ParD family antitoxin [Pseudomonadota bacterium]